MSIYIGTTEITKSGSGLPSTYQEVEYIQSSGTQYINTGVINKWNTLNIDIKFMLTYIQSGVEDGIFGGKYSSSQYQAPTLFINKDTSGLWNWAGSGMGVEMLTPASTNTLYNCNVTYTTTTRTWTLNGTSGTSNTGVSNNANNGNGYLSVFADGSGPMSYAYMRLYSFKITVNGTLVRNFVPCYRKSDNVIGLYDLVNNQFYTNAGTGTFTKGSDISTKGIYVGTTPVKEVYVGTTRVRPRLPSTYQEVEYIKSSGTQYIDTGHKPTIYDSVEIKFQTEASTSDTNLYGSRHRNSSTAPADQDFSVWINTSSGKGISVHYPFNNSEWGYTDTSWFYTSDIINTPVTLKVTPQYCYVNGSIKYTFNVTRTNYTPYYNAFLFAKNETGAASDYKIGKFKIYSAKIWDNGTLVRDFVPCYRKSDNVIGMYDLVNSAFYTNAGSGTFTK